MTQLCGVDTCQRDEEPRIVLDGARICLPCTTRLTYALTDLARAHRDLTDVLTPAGGGQGPRVSGSPTRPLPIRPDVAAHRRTIAAWLTDEAAMWHHELPTPFPPPSDVPALAAWLAARTGHARRHEWADTTHDAAIALRSRARHLGDLPPDRTRFPVAGCPEPDCTREARVWAHVPTDQNAPAYLACDTCGRTWHTLEWHTLGRRVGAQMRGLQHGAPALLAAIARGA